MHIIVTASPVIAPAARADICCKHHFAAIQPLELDYCPLYHTMIIWVEPSLQTVFFNRANLQTVFFNRANLPGTSVTARCVYDVPCAAGRRAIRFEWPVPVDCESASAWLHTDLLDEKPFQEAVALALVVLRLPLLATTSTKGFLFIWVSPQTQSPRTVSRYVCIL